MVQERDVAEGSKIGGIVVVSQADVQQIPLPKTKKCNRCFFDVQNGVFLFGQPLIKAVLYIGGRKRIAAFLIFAVHPAAVSSLNGIIAVVPSWRPAFASTPFYPS